MTTITRWDPFRELSTLRSELDRFFDEPVFNAPRLWPGNGDEATLALDISENEDEFTVTASVPGVAPEEIEITLSDNVLTIKGETKTEKEVEETRYHLRERRWGSFYRSITLPLAVEADKVEAVNENGVLTLHLPKAEAIKPKKISVKKMIKGA